LEGTVLTSKQVKLALQLSASFMPNEGVVASGAGSVNLWAARRVNSAVTTLTGTLPAVTIGGRSVKPSSFLVSNGNTLADRTLSPTARAFSVLELLSGWTN